MADDQLTPAKLRALLVTLLAGATGRSEATWRERIGDIEHVPFTVSPHSNWRLEGRGLTVERDAVAKAVEVTRVVHPYISWEASAG